jgi:AGCS family alanine or glycine:cation symporter
MCSKFTECTLGVKYRNEYPDGTVSGGPMYYLSKGLAEKGLGGLGRVLATVFAICCIVGSMGAGNMFQANQSFQMLTNVTGGADSILVGNGWLFGVIMAALVAVTIIGGIKSIARVTDKIVPFMAVMYVTAAIVIIAMNITELPDAIGNIVSGAFAPEAIGGGIVGVLIQGLKRATFSNEAGVGSAPIAHSAVRTKEPVTEGIVSLLEPFIDTVVICTMTALVIAVTGTYRIEGLGGIDITAAAFESAFSWFPYVLTLAVLLFAFSTMIAWSYYGLKAWTYLFGESKRAEITYKAIFCAFVIIGASIQLGPVIDFSDAMFFAMSIANIIGLYILMPVVKKEVTQYFEKLRTGVIVKYA